MFSLNYITDCLDYMYTNKSIVIHMNIFYKRTYEQRYEIVHFDTDAEGDYLAHVTFFARAKRVKKVT